MPRSLDIVEVGPRDGLQAESRVLPPAERAQLVLDLVAAGARRIEAVSFVHPDRVPQMAGAEEVMDGLRDRVPESVRLIGLVLNRRGLDRALESGVDEVNTVLAASDEFALANQGQRVEALVDECLSICSIAGAAGVPVSVTVSTSFGCPYQGEVGVGVVVDLVERIVGGGATEIALADTVGAAVPADVVERFGAVLPLFADHGVRARGHFHDTRNTALANVWAAIGLGVSSIDASVGGIGGCPFAPGATGNVATEDVVYLAERSGLDTGIDLSALLALVPQVEEAVGHPASGSVSRAGPFPRPVAGGPGDDLGR